MGSISIIDIFIVIPLVFAVVRGAKRGFVMELTSLMAWLLGIWGAIHFSKFIAVVLIQSFNIKGQYLPLLAFLVTFLLIIVAVNLIGKLVDMMIGTVSKGAVNKISGAILAALKTLLLIGLFFLFFDGLNRNWNVVSKETLQSSRLYYPVISATEKTVPYLKSFRNDYFGKKSKDPKPSNNADI